MRINLFAQNIKVENLNLSHPELIFARLITAIGPSIIFNYNYRNW